MKELVLCYFQVANSSQYEVRDATQACVVVDAQGSFYSCESWYARNDRECVTALHNEGASDCLNTVQW